MGRKLALVVGAVGTRDVGRGRDGRVALVLRRGRKRVRRVEVLLVRVGVVIRRILLVLLVMLLVVLVMVLMLRLVMGLLGM